jgi:hypothetical protein
MQRALSQDIVNRIERELMELDREMVDVGGVSLKPSQCYHVDTDPTHVLFNTNCPDDLKKKVNTILSKYIPGYESGAQAGDD